MAESKHYREWINRQGLTNFQVRYAETDLFIMAESNLSAEAKTLILKYHKQVKDYIHKNPAFKTSLEPLSADNSAPPIINEMIEAGQKACVGPMAAVAGAIAEYIGRELLPFSHEIIIENGGDLFIKSSRERVAAIYAGTSPLSGKIGVKIPGDSCARGVCTSSGTFGHAISFGKADAALAVSRSAALADAAATAIGNAVKTAADIDNALKLAQQIPGIDAALIIIEANLGAWGDIEFTRLDTER